MNTAEKIYSALKKIPKGKVSTYKEIADFVGLKSYRGAGQIIAHNPNAPEVPCHRIVMSDGKLGGYAFGIKKKIEILKKEGVMIANGKVQDFEKKLFKFSSRKN